jgi:hypothetical protein
MTSSHPEDQPFFTDKELRTRWRCSQMTLQRLRTRGVLGPPLKLGQGDVKRRKNLTAAADVRALEDRRAS